MKLYPTIVGIVLLFVGLMGQTTNPKAPIEPVKLVMVHASIGRAWLCNGTNFGNLGGRMGANNYYVSDLDRNWDAPENPDVFYNDYVSRGTAPGQIYTWFFDSTIQGNGITRSKNILGSIYTADNAFSHAPEMNYKRDYMENPGGENCVILIKPTHVASEVRSDNGEDWKKLIGKDGSNSAHTISNIKEMYNQIANYAVKHPEKMFVFITPPPHGPAETGNPAFSNTLYAANARALNNWMVRQWLRDLGHANKNVYVFDFFNVVTGANNHHRVVGTAPNFSVEHVVDPASLNFGFPGYYSNQSDPHPAGGGAGEKASLEFVPLLNVFYNRYLEWKTPVSIDRVQKPNPISLRYSQENSSFSFTSPSTAQSFTILTVSGKIIGTASLRSEQNSVSIRDIVGGELSNGAYVALLSTGTQSSSMLFHK